MLEDVLHNRQHILICIQYEVLQKKSVDEAYKSFCHILGDNAMEYHEFDFWYYHFLNGNFDLDYDRSKGPKLRGLSDISVDIAKKIVEKLNWKEKCIFRNVSKKCREVADMKPIFFNQIDFNSGYESSSVKFDTELFFYNYKKREVVVLLENDMEKKNINESKREECSYELDEEENEEERLECQKQAIQKLAIALNNPRVQIKKLYVRSFGDRLTALFESLNHQIHVELFNCSVEETAGSEYFEVAKILQHLKPGVLENIQFELDDPYGLNSKEKFGKLAKLEQWKKAKQVNGDPKVLDNVEEFAHFDRLESHSEDFKNLDNVVRLKNIYLNSPTFERCHLHSHNLNVEEIRRKLGGDRFPMADGGTLCVDIDRYKVPVFTLKPIMESITENLLKNQQHILACIQFVMIRGDTSFEAYENFCKFLGEDVMKYQEFDFYYHRFLNGELDLDYDRSKDPVKPELSDVPIDVVEKIVDKLHPIEKLIFRNVSKKCREIVDKKPIVIDEIDFIINDPWDKERGTILKVDDRTFKYTYKLPCILLENGVEKSRIDHMRRAEDDIEKKECEKQAAKLLAIILKNPRVQIELFYIFINSDCDVPAGSQLLALFESLNHQIHVESFNYRGDTPDGPECFKFTKFLPHLKPGVLEHIELYFEYSDCKLDLDKILVEITELDQWKQATIFWTDYEANNIEKLTHFHRLGTDIAKDFNLDNMVKLKNIYLKSSTFEECILQSYESLNTEEIRRKLGSDRFPMADGGTLLVDVSEHKVTFKKE